MINVLGSVADRLLSRIVPKHEAEAGCSYTWYLCYCSRGLAYSKRCMYGCSGVPNHCYPCNTVTGTC